MTRKLFQIGFNKCGTTFIERLFRMNNIPSVHWSKGALAEDIAYSKITGRAPLQPWTDTAIAFTDMEAVRHINTPIIEAFREYAYLDQHFPGAVFLLNTRDVEDWINSRYMHLGGTYARHHALSRGVKLADLGDLWRADWQAHLQGCRDHFGDRPELVEIDIDHASPDDYRTALSPWFDLPLIPELPDDRTKDRRKQYQVRLSEQLSQTQPGEAVTTDQRDAVSATLAQFARPRVIAHHDTPPTADARQIVQFDVARGELRDGEGAVLPIRRGPGGAFYVDPQARVPLLIAAAANDIAQITDRGVYRLDMRDACRWGSAPRFQTDGPVIAPSRRDGAENVFLWPMPRYHRQSNTAFLGPEPARFTPLSHRADRAIWQGGLSGYARGRNGPNLNQRAEAVVEQMLQARPDTPQFQAARDKMRGLNRIAFVLAHQDSPDLDLYLRPDKRDADALRRAGLGKQIVADGPGADQLHSHRYVISLGGAPMDPDLLPAMNAGAVVLKEEDGWQLYYNCLLRPWEHYIPLNYGGDDLTEKLAWARANPEACAQMVQRSRQTCDTLADPVGRAQHLGMVLAEYRASTGQEG